MVIDHFDKLDVCRRVIDLDNVERVVCPDVTRSRVKPVQVFTIQETTAGNFFRGEQDGNVPCDSDTGRRPVPFQRIARANLFYDRCKVRLFRAQLHLSEGHCTDALERGAAPWFP